MNEPREHGLETRGLGRTHLHVTRLGLGLAALGRPGYINLGHAEDLDRQYRREQMRAGAHAVLDQAWACGIRYFDAARSYGGAEAFLGSWLASRSVAADACTVGSKWGYRYTADWKIDAKVHEQKEHSVERLREQWPESCEQLGDHLDVYMIHSATIESGVLDRVDVLEELARIRATGVAIGLSVSGPRQAETARRAFEVEVDGGLLFDVVQATWNVLERSAESVLRDAHRAGVGILLKETLANGRLTQRNNEPEFRTRREILAREAERIGTSIENLALAAALANEWADVVLSGATTPAQAIDNVGAASITIDDQTQSVLVELAEDSETYWATRSRLSWN